MNVQSSAHCHQLSVNIHMPHDPAILLLQNSRLGMCTRVHVLELPQHLPNNRELKTTHTFVHTRLDKQMVVYLFGGLSNGGILLYSNENKSIRTAHNNLQEPHKHNVEQKSDTKRTYCVIPLIKSTVTGKRKL